MNRSFTIAAASIAAGMAFIDTTALTVALPALRASLAASDSALLWIHNAYAIPLAALLLLGGSLGDRYGTRRVFLFGIAAFGLASIACGLAPNVTVLMIFRALQGMAAALMIPASLAMIARVTPGHSLGRAIGIWSVFTLIATALGPVVGGLLVQQGLWRGVFFINVPLAIAALIITVTRTEADAKNDSPPLPLDFYGAFLLVAGLACLSIALIDQPNLLFATGVVCILFVFQQQKSAHPLLPRGVFKSRSLILATLISLLIYSAWAGFTYLLPSYLIEVLHFTPAKAGLLQLPSIVLLAALSPVAGKLLDRRGPRLPLTLGTLFSAAGFTALLWSGFEEYPIAILLPLLLLGVGLGFCAAPLSATILSSVPPRHHGLAAGINSTAARVASALGVALLGSLAYRQHHLDFSALAISAAVLCLLATPVALSFTRVKISDKTGET
jgi:EmrB/QacA subfamily drug resistance transporter